MHFDEQTDGKDVIDKKTAEIGTFAQALHALKQEYKKIAEPAEFELDWCSDFLLKCEAKSPNCAAMQLTHAKLFLSDAIETSKPWVGGGDFWKNDVENTAEPAVVKEAAEVLVKSVSDRQLVDHVKALEASLVKVKKIYDSFDVKIPPIFTDAKNDAKRSGLFWLSGSFSFSSVLSARLPSNGR